MAKKGDNEWHLVSRKNKSSPVASSAQVPLRFIPYSSRPTFAQVLTSPPRNHSSSQTFTTPQPPPSHLLQHSVLVPPSQNSAPAPPPQHLPQPLPHFRQVIPAPPPQQPPVPTTQQPYPVHYPALLDYHINELRENLKT